MTIDINAIIQRALTAVKTREPLTGSEWADKYFYLSPESSGIEGRWKTLPYQIGPLNWMCDDDIEEINFMKSARVGFTKCLLISVGYGIEHKKRNIAIWQPTDGDAKDFMNDEVDTMLRDVPALGNLLKVPPGTKSKFSTIDKKTFHGAILDVKGGKSGRNYRRMTKDVAMYDELDGFDLDVDGEGSPTELGDTRTQTSSFPKSIRGSTPRVKGVSLIEKAIKNCKMVFYRHLPCPACKKTQKLEFKNFAWEENEPSTVRYLCKHCGSAIQYHQYADMDAAGRWQTDEGHYYLDDTDLFYDPDGQVIDRPKRIGAHIWSAYSYFTTWENTIEKWIEAVAESKTGSNTKLKTVINTRLGETWEEKGEKVNVDIFSDDRLDEYHFDDAIPNDVLVITIGADVQGGMNARIELEIIGWGIGEESWSLDYVVIQGDPEEENVWEHLDDHFSRSFTRKDGVVLGVHGGCVDSGYLPDRVFQFTGPRVGRRIYATKGKSQYSGPIFKTSQEQFKNKKIIQLAINTDAAKETIFNRLNKVTEPGPCFCHFPNHYAAEYFKKLTNEEKREKRRSGQIVGHEWYKLGPNEPLDCRCLGMVAFKKLNPPMERIKMRLEAEAERIRLRLPLEPRKSGRRVRSQGATI